MLAGGWAVSVPLLAVGLRRLPWNKVMNVAILSAAFFAASLFHLPLGPGNVHLVLNGLMGVILGWAAVPAIFAALFLQALLFQYGGLAVLGVNTCVMGLPPILAFLIFRPLLLRPTAGFAAAFCCGAFSILLSGFLAALALHFSGEDFSGPALALLTANIPLSMVEGVATAFIFNFLKRARPEFLVCSAAKS